VSGGSPAATATRMSWSRRSRSGVSTRWDLHLHLRLHPTLPDVLDEESDVISTALNAEPSRLAAVCAQWRTSPPPAPARHPPPPVPARRLFLRTAPDRRLAGIGASDRLSAPRSSPTPPHPGPGPGHRPSTGPARPAVAVGRRVPGPAVVEPCRGWVRIGTGSPGYRTPPPSPTPLPGTVRLPVDAGHRIRLTEPAQRPPTRHLTGTGCSQVPTGRGAAPVHCDIAWSGGFYRRRSTPDRGLLSATGGGLAPPKAPHRPRPGRSPLGASRSVARHHRPGSHTGPLRGAHGSRPIPAHRSGPPDAGRWTMSSLVI
jgi:hypothetical protein